MTIQERRKARREYVRKMNNRFSASTQTADEILDAIDNGGFRVPDPNIVDGSRVRIDVERIKAQKSYPEMQKAYRDFVEANASTKFTVRLDGKQLGHFEEDPTWQFWIGDLILA